MRTFSQGGRRRCIRGHIPERLPERLPTEASGFAALCARGRQPWKFSREATIVVGIIKAMEPSPQRSKLVDAYSSSLPAIYVSMIAVAGFYMVLSARTKVYSLQQEQVTKQGLVQQAQQPMELKDLELGNAKA